MLKGKRVMPKENIPPLSSYISDDIAYVNQNYEYIKGRLNAHQNNKCTNIVFITDIHLDSPTLTYSYTRIKRLNKVISVIKKLSTEFKIHGCVLGGDYLYSSGSTHTYQEAIDRFSAINKEAKRLVNTMHVMICRGNHDGNSEGGYVDGRSVFTYENTNAVENGANYCDAIQDGINGGDVNNGPTNTTTGKTYKYYGYFDDINNKVRVIYLSNYDLPFEELRSLDSSTGTYKVSANHNMQKYTYLKQKQIDFLIDALTFSESGWGVVIFAHTNICADSGWAPGGNSTPPTIMKNIIQAFKTKSSYSATFTPSFPRVDGTSPSITVDGIAKNPYHLNVNCDFTSNKSNLLITAVQGHRHTDTLAESPLPNETNVHTIRTEAFYTHGYIYKTGVYDSAFDIVTIDRTNNKVFMERYGDGISRDFNILKINNIVTGDVEKINRQVKITVIDLNSNPVSEALVIIKVNGTVNILDDSKNYEFVNELSDFSANSDNFGKYYLYSINYISTMYATIEIKRNGSSYRKEYVGTTICAKTNVNGECTIGDLPSDALDIIVSKNQLKANPVHVTKTATKVTITL